MKRVYRYVYAHMYSLKCSYLPCFLQLACGNIILFFGTVMWYMQTMRSWVSGGPSMYTYVYRWRAHTHICICVTFLQIYTYTYIYTHVYIHPRICTSIYRHTRRLIFIMYRCAYIQIYVYIYIYMFIYVHDFF